MFAGPNGSGKSTLKSYLTSALLGIYLNPDEIEQKVREQGFLDFSGFSIQAKVDETHKFFTDSTSLKEHGLNNDVSKLVFKGGRLDFANTTANSYFILTAVEFLRQKLLQQKKLSRLRLSCRTRAK
jgi:ABC-type cobalamin/Fe3+-siderophores transport system ATPase subunit